MSVEEGPKRPLPVVNQTQAPVKDFSGKHPGKQISFMSVCPSVTQQLFDRRLSDTSAGQGLFWEASWEAK